MNKVDYEELYRNAYNPTWSGWSNAYAVITDIEKKGSVSKKYPNSRIKHLLNFLNGHLLEERVRIIMNLEYYGPDHEYLYAKLGEKIPDFVDKIGRKFELKSRWNLSDARYCDWYNADVCLFYCNSDNTLYEYKRRTGEFKMIKPLRAPYVDIAKYPYEDKDLFKL